MATQTYIISVDGNERATFSANFAEASSPILIDGRSTPFQVADARHRETRAAQILIDWCRSQGGPIVDEDEDWEVEEQDS